MQVDELEIELQRLGRAGFEDRYGRHFLVFTDPDLAEEISSFVNTMSRTGQDLFSGKKATPLDVRPLLAKAPGSDRSRVTLGRARTCDVVVRNARVSSHHAEFTRGGGLLFITDVGSKNGTSVNGNKVPAKKPNPVDVGDTITFGTVTATLWGIDDLLAALR